MSPREETAALLQAWQEGSEDAGERLMRRIYREIRRVAARQLAEIAPEITLQPTEVVHEVYCKLLDQRQVVWANRSHFLAICARLIRRILLNHIRDRNREKRGGTWIRVPLQSVRGSAPGPSPDLLALDESLQRLEAIDEQAARVVELRYFGGLTLDETAFVLGISRASVVRSWRYARSWLRDSLRSRGY